MRFGLVLRGRKPPAVGVTDFTNVTFARSLMEGMADGTQAWPAQRMKYLVFTISCVHYSGRLEASYMQGFVCWAPNL